MTAPVFTQWDFLDPESMRQKLADAHASDVWDNFSMLSPERAEQQINALSPNVGDNAPFNNLRGIYNTRWTPGDDDSQAIDWSLADSIGSI
jgi:hypothetical protein